MNRIFIGIKISKSLAEKTLGWKKKHNFLPVRWISEKNLHITLIPPFHEQNVDTIKTKIELLKNFSDSIVIEFNRLSFGPNPKYPRLIWATAKTSKKLIKLKKYLHKILDKQTERRPFSLHLTLARFSPKDFRKFPVKKLDEKISWEERILSVVVFKSILSPKGAQYRILKEVKLKQSS